MKKYLILLLVVCVFVMPAFAYTIKIYNKAGNLIGTAKKVGNDYEIYDLNDKKVTDYDAFYASEGDADRKKIKDSTNFITTDYGWARVTTYPDGTKIPRSTLSYVATQAWYNPYKVIPYKFRVYDKTGKNVGYAIKGDSEDFIIYDLNDKILQTTETLYYPPGTPLSEYLVKINKGIRYYIPAR